MEYSGPPGFWNSEGGRRRKTPIARTSAKLSSEELNERGVDIESAGTSEDVAVLRVVSKFQSPSGTETYFIPREHSDPLFCNEFLALAVRLSQKSRNC